MVKSCENWRGARGLGQSNLSRLVVDQYIANIWNAAAVPPFLLWNRMG